MQTYLECVPCFVRQTIDAVRSATPDPAVHDKVLREVLAAASRMDFADSPPEMGRYIHGLIRRYSGNPDPYRETKERSNRLALGIAPMLEQRVNAARDPLEACVKIAIAGNAIDCGPNGGCDGREIAGEVERALASPLRGTGVHELRQAAERARKILYLGDNAGEIVFDRFLVERLPRDKITFAVRGSPVLNDATMADARAACITDLVEVIDNGSDAPGTILDDSSDAFRVRFDEADLVIAKGQGNYETLSDSPKDIFFLLMVKCPVIAAHIGCEVGEIVVKRSDAAAASAWSIEGPAAGKGGD
jgi:uncharacterized protein with ATP-grasp and redox domains